jgi:small-conductance mechanosensitive channel
MKALASFGLLLFPVSLLGQENSFVKNFETELTKMLDGLEATLNLYNILLVLLLIATAFLLSFILRRYVQRKAAESARRRLGILRWLPIINLFIWMVVAIGPALLIILSHPDVMWPFLAAIAVVLGISAKDGMMDLLSGLWLMFEGPFQIGDRIQVGEHYGEVKGIKIRSTQINTLDDNLVTIPNSKVLGDAIANANAGQSACMVVVDMLLPIDINIKAVRRMAFEATITSPYVNYREPVSVLFSDYFGDPPGTQLTIKAYVFDTRFEKALASDVAEAAKQAFQEAGVYQ